jgi:hypothetical protein
MERSQYLYVVEWRYVLSKLVKLFLRTVLLAELHREQNPQCEVASKSTTLGALHSLSSDEIVGS